MVSLTTQMVVNPAIVIPVAHWKILVTLSPANVVADLTSLEELAINLSKVTTLGTLIY